MILEIDGLQIKTASDFHDRLMAVPGMPDFYGRNFSALNDVLTGFIERPFKIVWRNASMSRANLGGDVDKFVLVMQGAVEYTTSSERKFEFEITE